MFKCLWFHPCRKLTNRPKDNMTPNTWEKCLHRQATPVALNHDTIRMRTKQRVLGGLRLFPSMLSKSHKQEFIFLLIFTFHLLGSGAPQPYIFTHDPDALTALLLLYTYIHQCDRWQESSFEWSGVFGTYFHKAKCLQGIHFCTTHKKGTYGSKFAITVKYCI